MIQSEVEKQNKAGTIRRSQSAWPANFVVVAKKDGTIRVCQDYRGLNVLLESKSGGLGDIASIFDNIKGTTCFTSIDLASSFTQLEIAEEDKHKTAFHDAHGELWEFNGCGFGLKTHPSGFAAYVGEELGPLKSNGVQNWLDDIIFHTRHVDGHVDLVEKVLARLHQFGLSVNLAKSIWCAPQQAFVSMVVSRLGVQPSRAKIEAVAKLARTNTVEEIKSLLGMGSYLRKFVRGYSSLVAPTWYFGPSQGQAVRIKNSKEAPGAVGRGAGQGSEGADRVSHITTDSGVARLGGHVSVAHRRQQAGRWSCTHAGH